MNTPLAPGRLVTWEGFGWAALAGLLALLAPLAGWRGSDLPAHLFRVGLVERDGFTVWNNHWFGGHHTVGYSVLVPVAGALVGLWALAVVSAAGAAWLFDAVVRRALGERRPLASCCFALGTFTNVLVGRIPFALGLALALAAVLAVLHRRGALAGALAVATALASPVAGAFLALAFTSWALASRGPTRAQRLVLAVLAAAPVVVLAVLYPQGGTFPLRWPAMVWTVGVSLGVAWLVPERHRAVRWGAGLYALVVVLVFLVPNPLGGNVVRLGMYVAAPLLLALVAPSRRLALAVVPALVWWQWSPALDTIVHANADESTQETFYEPLLGFLGSVGAETERIEVVPTKRHWETVYVALDFPIARGWERQLDLRYHGRLYDDDLTAREYRAWLHDTGVSYVALADAPLDPGGEAEARLLERGIQGLELVWADAGWRVWEVLGEPDLVDGTATVLAVDADRLELWVTRPSDVLVRVRASAYWAAEPARCIETGDDGWILVRDAEIGFLALSVDGTQLVDADNPCDQGSG